MVTLITSVKYVKSLLGARLTGSRVVWGVICVKFHRHSVQAQLATMLAQSANMRAEHEGTT